MIEKIPPAVCQDPAHAEIVIIVLFLLAGWLLKLFMSEKKKNRDIEDNWKNRIEGKLDQALLNHEQCQRLLPEKYGTKNEFSELLKECNHQWEDFNRKFESLLERLWNHKHIDNCDVERMK